MRLLFAELALLLALVRPSRSDCDDLIKADVASDMVSAPETYSLNRKNSKTTLTCLGNRESRSKDDRGARKTWRRDLGKDKKVVYKCKNGKWVQRGNTGKKAPRCPSGAKNSWNNFNWTDPPILVIDNEPIQTFHTNCVTYYETGKRMPQADAKNFCLSHGLDLAQQRDQSEFKLMETRNSFWLDAVRSTEWVWGDAGTSDINSDCSMWRSGEPNNPSKKCAHTNFYGGWNDIPCKHSENVVCEFRTCVPICGQSAGQDQPTESPPGPPPTLPPCQVDSCLICSSNDANICDTCLPPKVRQEDGSCGAASKLVCDDENCKDCLTISPSICLVCKDGFTKTPQQAKCQKV